MDYSYHHLLQHLDNGASRFAKYKKKQSCPEVPGAEHDDVAQQQPAISDVDNCTTQFEKCALEKALEDCRKALEDCRAQFKKCVLKKAHTKPTTDELNVIRDHMRQFISSEQEFFSMFQIYFDEFNPEFATKFKYMLNNDCDEIIKWMKDSLFPFGEQLVKWCDGGANGNLST